MTGGPEDQVRIPKLAIASYFLSLSSLILGPFGFIPGILCGHFAQHRIARDPSLEDPGFAKSGLILGYTFYGLTLLAVASFAIYASFHLVKESYNFDRLWLVERDLETLEDYLDRYHDHTGSYPTTAQRLKALYERPVIEPIPPNWRSILSSEYTIDPWNNPYHYRCPGIRNPETYDLSCLGPDGEEGTADDTITR